MDQRWREARRGGVRQPPRRRVGAGSGRKRPGFIGHAAARAAAVLGVVVAALAVGVAAPGIAAGAPGDNPLGSMGSPLPKAPLAQTAPLADGTGHLAYARTAWDLGAMAAADRVTDAEILAVARRVDAAVDPQQPMLDLDIPGRSAYVLGVGPRRGEHPQLQFRALAVGCGNTIVQVGFGTDSRGIASVGLVQRVEVCGLPGVAVGGQIWGDYALVHRPGMSSAGIRDRGFVVKGDHVEAYAEGAVYPLSNLRLGYSPVTVCMVTRARIEGAEAVFDVEGWVTAPGECRSRIE